MRYFKAFAAVTAVLFVLSPAGSAQVNDQGADEIRRAIKVWMGQNLQGATHDIELDGQIAVVPDGALYRVTLPGGRVVFQGEGTVHIGEIKVDLTPMDNGWYDASWRLPDSYRMESHNGSEVLITIGGQTAQGQFAPEFQTIMSMDGELREIEVREIGDDSRLIIDRVSAIARSTEVSPGVFDTKANYRLDRLELEDSGGREMLELKELEIVGIADGARLLELTEFQRRSNALTSEINGGGDADQIKTQIGAYADFIESMPTVLAGISFEASHGPISILDHGDQFLVNDGTLTMTMEGLDGDRSQIVIAAGSSGIEASDPEVAKLLPKETRFRLAMVDLPNSELVQLAIGTLRSAGTTDPAMAMMMATGGLQQALSTAGSEFEIGPIRLASDIASIDLEGTLRPETSSPYSVVGELDMVATGLDALIVEIQQSGSDQDAVQFLTLLQTLGAQAPDADGRSVRTYAFRLDTSGTLLLNGADIMPLISGMQ